MTDIATIGLRVDSKELRTAHGDLDGLSSRSRAAEAALGVLPPRFAAIASSARLTAAGFVAAGAAVAGLATTVGVQAVRAFAQLEQEQATYNAVLRATGFAAGRTADDIEDLATSIRKASTTTEGEVRQAAAILLTFRSVAGDSFDDALKLSQDLAAVGFGSITSAATMLGKALEEPEQGLTALRRVGVSFSETQKQIIKNFIETGQRGKAMETILDGVRQQVGGAAAAQGSTLTGAWNQLSEATNNWLERVGGQIAKATRLRDVVSGLADAIDRTNKAAETAGSPEARIDVLQRQLRQLDATPGPLRRARDEQERARILRELATAQAEVAKRQQEIDGSMDTAEYGRQTAEEDRRRGLVEGVAAALAKEGNELKKTTLQREISNEIKKAEIDLSTEAGRSAGEDIARRVRENFYLREGSGLYQQRVSLLGDAASIEEVARAKRASLNDAIKQGVDLSKAEVAGIIRRTEEQTLGITALKAQTDAYRVEVETLGMSVGAAKSYEAEQNALNEARRNGRDISPEWVAALRSEAEAMGAAAQRAEDLKFAHGAFRSLFTDFGSALRSTNTELTLTQRLLDAAQQSGLNFLNRISDKLLQMAADNLWTNAFGGARAGGRLFSLFGGGAAAGAGGGAYMMGTTPVPLFHGGGFAGVSAAMSRSVDPGIFAGAPRYHGGGIAGLQPNEVPAILQRGEPVGWGNAASVTVNVPVNIAGGSTPADDDRTLSKKIMAVLRSPAFEARVEDSVKRARARGTGI